MTKAERARAKIPAVELVTIATMLCSVTGEPAGRTRSTARAARAGWESVVHVEPMAFRGARPGHSLYA